MQQHPDSMQPQWITKYKRTKLFRPAWLGRLSNVTNACKKELVCTRIPIKRGTIYLRGVCPSSTHASLLKGWTIYPVIQITMELILHNKNRLSREWGNVVIIFNSTLTHKHNGIEFFTTHLLNMEINLAGIKERVVHFLSHTDTKTQYLFHNMQHKF